MYDHYLINNFKKALTMAKTKSFNLQLPVHTILLHDSNTNYKFYSEIIGCQTLN